MKTVLYFNYGVTKACGVYDLGLRHYNSIKGIPNYNIIYEEVNNYHEYKTKCAKYNPDLIIFNYLEGLSPWLNGNIHIAKCPKVCIPHDMRQGDLTSFKRTDIFDYYIILDHNSYEEIDVYKSDRPLKEFENTDVYQYKVPRIGSFGFALMHKRFNLIVREVNKTFDDAIINFHMPHAYYDFANETAQVIESCKQEITKNNIILNITTDFLSEDNVINMLHGNDINCLFYDAPRDLGISSSLDFLISAQKPILITESPMFRSFSKRLPQFPNTTLGDIWDRWEEQQVNVCSIYNDSINRIKIDTKNIFDTMMGIL